MRKSKASVNVSQKNIHAILQQRRLRHINGICIRNLTINDNAASGGASAQLNEKSSTGERIYFKIVSTSQDTEGINGGVIFESEHTDPCPNPSWLGFVMPKNGLTTGNMLHLQLWTECTSSGSTKKLLSWSWDLSRLCYLAERLYHGETSFFSNALIVQINGSFYSLSGSFSTDTPHGNCPHFNVDEEKVSCNIFSLRRMVTSKKSIASSRQRSSEYVRSCERFLHEREFYMKRKKHIEDLTTHLKILKLLLARETSLSEIETKVLADFASQVKNEQVSLMKKRTAAMQEQERSNEVTDQLIISNQRTNVLNGQLSARRIEVLSELAYIFPIIPYTPPIGARNITVKGQKQSPKPNPTYMICNIFLPEAESLIAKDDSKNAVAMGYVSQMLYMVSYFLLIPLRYPITLQGSQSSIIDNILEKIQEKERVFPLYVKTNKERFMFEYGVYLLNKNIGQLRFLLGIPTSDLRPTLCNLKTLLEHAISAQHGRPSSIRQSVSYSVSKTPERNRSPKPGRKDEKDIPEPRHIEINGIRKAPADLEEKVHDKSLELHTLRGELFGSKKNSKPISPLHSTAPNTSHEVASSYLNVKPDVSIVITDSSETVATFLTGLEDLDHSPKAERKSQKPLDIVTARNELFKTKSGRPIITKKHTYTMRPGHTSQSENYFSAKEQLYEAKCDKSSKKDDDPVESSNPTKNGLATSEDMVPKFSPAPLAVSEDMDLC